MAAEKVIERACTQLNRVLGFFPGVEAKISSIFAINIAMLGLLALNLQKEDFSGEHAFYFLCGIAGVVGTLSFSIGALYYASSPQLRGPVTSLIYFHSIANRTEAEYLRDYKRCTDSEYGDELLSQVWRNSQILTCKFYRLKLAFRATLFAVLLWATVLAYATIKHGGLTLGS